MKRIEHVNRFIRELRRLLGVLHDQRVWKGMTVFSIVVVLGGTQIVGFRQNVSYLLLLIAAVVIVFVLLYAVRKAVLLDRADR